jgi:hypothetical protein
MESDPDQDQRANHPEHSGVEFGGLEEGPKRMKEAALHLQTAISRRL